MRSRPPSHAARAFSLIEMLVVVSLLILIASIVVPAFSSVVRGIEMTQAQQTLHQHFAAARQTALARNRRVEVRLYRYRNPQGVDPVPTFGAVQSFLIEENNRATALRSVIRLPTSVLMNEVPINSSLLTLPAKTNWDPSTDPKLALPGVGTDYEVRAFQFRPDGATNLDPTQNWYVTLHAASSGGAPARLPANFATIQVDPVSGAVRSYRP